MTTTVICRECDYCTDLEETSETNPKRCPECGESLYIDGTDEELVLGKGQLDLRDDYKEVRNYRESPCDFLRD